MIKIETLLEMGFQTPKLMADIRSYYFIDVFGKKVKVSEITALIYFTVL